jgi:hypothetical protein
MLSQFEYLLGLEDSEETSLLLGGLETTVAHLGRSVDELEVDFLDGAAGHLGEEGLSEGDDTLLRSHDATLKHDPVLVDLTVVGEATHGGDGLLGQIVGGHGVVSVVSQSLSDSVDLLVDLSSVVETILTSSRNSVRDSGRMPRSDTSDLSLASVGLSGKDGNTPSLDDTSVSVTLCYADNVNHLVGAEDGRHRDLLLEQLGAEVNFVRNGSTVHLDLDDVGLLLADLSLGDLSVHDSPDDLAVLLSSGDLSGHLVVVSVSLGVLGEGLLLGLVPVLVETSSALVAEVLSPDGSEGSETLGSLGVTNETNAHHGGSLQDGDRLSDLFLVELGTRLLHISEDVGHTGLVTHESGQMARLGLIILGEGLDLTSEVLSSLSGQETERTTAGMLELSMRHK